MKDFFRYSIISGLILLVGCASHTRFAGQPPDDTTLQAEFSRIDLLEDVAFIRHTLDAVHPDINFHLGESRADSAWAAVEASLVDGMDRVALWRLLASTLALYGDGHTFAAPPYEGVEAYLSDGGLLFPWTLDLQGRRAFVIHEFLDEPLVPPGSEVISINDRPIAGLIGELTLYFSAEKMTTRIEFLERNLIQLFPLLYGWGESFTLRLVTTAGEQRTVTAAGITLEEYQTITGRQTGTRQPPYAFERLEQGRIGYLDFRSFADPGRFAGFLEEMFTDISNNPVEALVIDLRRNGGGNSRLGAMLLGYLTHEPWTQVARMDIRVSRQIKAYYRSNLPKLFRRAPGFLIFLANRQARDIFTARSGEIVSFRNEPSSSPANPLRYDGKVYVLIGTRTYSSATMFATTVKDHGLATLVGEETGGPASHYGDIYTFYPPHTRLRMGVSHKYFLRPSEEDDGQGCLPDFEVITTPDDRSSGRDPVLERTLELIRNQERRFRFY